MKYSVVVPNFEKHEGLIVVVTQEFGTGIILMVAHTDRAGFFETLATGEAVYYSTSRQKRWKKGEESGNNQKIRSVLIDCDGDAVIYIVEQKGNACHIDKHSCFYRSIIGSILEPADGKFDVEYVEVHKNIS